MKHKILALSMHTHALLAELESKNIPVVVSDISSISSSPTQGKTDLSAIIKAFPPELFEPERFYEERSVIPPNFYNKRKR